MRESRDDSRWIRCPICNSKTRTRVYADTVMFNFPLFCPKCIRRRETTVEPFKSDTPTAEIRHSFRWSDSWGCKRGDRLICQPPRRLT